MSTRWVLAESSPSGCAGPWRRCHCRCRCPRPLTGGSYSQWMSARGYARTCRPAQVSRVIDREVADVADLGCLMFSGMRVALLCL